MAAASTVNEFFVKAVFEPALLKALKDAEDAAAVVSLANQHGFVFSLEDLLAAAPRFTAYRIAQEKVRERRNEADALLALIRSAPPEQTLLPINGGGDPPPSLADIVVREFTVNPRTIRPKSGGAVISWRVDVPAGLAATIALNNVRVTSSSSVREDPIATKTYWLTASRPGASRILASATIEVDNTGCTDVVEHGFDLFHDLAAAQAILEYGGRGQEFDAGGIPAVVRFESTDDLEVTLDGDLILFSWKLSLEVGYFVGGRIESKIWIRPFAHDGIVENYAEKAETKFDLPAGAKAAIFFGGPAWWAVTAVVAHYTVSTAEPRLKAATSDGFLLISGVFYRNVISVVLVHPSSGDEPVLRAIVRKAECL